MAAFALCAPVGTVGAGQDEGGDDCEDQPAGRAEKARDGAEEGEGSDHRISPLAFAVWARRSARPFVPPLMARVRPSRSSASALAFSLRPSQ